MSTKPNHWNQKFIELEDGGLACYGHATSICTKCPFDYSLLEQTPDHDNEKHKYAYAHTDAMTEGESLLGEVKLAEYKSALIAMKGCACHFPFLGSGCKKCNPQSKPNPNAQEEKGERSEATALKNKILKK